MVFFARSCILYDIYKICTLICKHMIKIIESFDVEELLPIVKPVKLLDTLLDEIKLRRPSASVKGAIWTLVGLLHSKYDNLVHNRLVESQDVCLH